MRKRKGERKGINLLELVPVQNIKWEKTNKGLIVLLKPKIKHPFFAKHILTRLKNPFYKVRLDELGSFIWEQCDGVQTVRDLASNLREKFGEKVEPLYDRLASFLQSLEKNQFIFYKDLPRKK